MKLEEKNSFSKTREHRMDIAPCISSVVCTLSMTVGTFLVFFAVTNSTTNNNATGSSRNSRGVSLPLPDGSKGKAPWYIDWNRFDSASFSNDDMKVTYQAGKFGGNSGAAFRARPLKQFPRDSATLGCSIFVPANFDFTKGGKLGPGLCIGTERGVCATGGDHMSDAGSARVSFSEDGDAVAYIYIPEQADKNHGRTGDKVLKSSRLQKGTWNAVSIGVTLGRPGQDGSVTLIVNGSSTTSSVKWRTASDVRISGVLFTTFFGGNDSSYAPKTTQTISYKNFWIE